MYFTNTWYAQYMPILSSHAFDNRGKYYNVTRILTPQNTLDPVKYHEYSPLYLPTVFSLSYGLSFASVCATLTHAFLYYRKQVRFCTKLSCYIFSDTMFPLDLDPGSSLHERAT